MTSAERRRDDRPFTPPPTGDGLRFNEGKNRLSLLPPEWLWALGLVMTRGAIKYEDRNWEKGVSWAYVVDSMERHWLKFKAGERYDKDLGCHHLAMCAWNALVLMTYDLRKIGTNDLASQGIESFDGVAIEMGPEMQAIAAKKKAAAQAAKK